MITQSTSQYFTTLFHNYRVQVGHGDAVEKRTKTQDRSRGASRKLGKLMRRNKAIPAFEKSHGVTGLALLVDRDYMSSEDSEGPGNATEAEWQAAAAVVQIRGASTPWEIIRLQWRSKQVSVNIFYMMEQIAYKAGSWSEFSTRLTRLHGCLRSPTIHDSMD